MFDEFPVLTTERLTLRNIEIFDAEEIFQMRSNGRVNQFIARETMRELDDSVRLIKKTRAAYRKKQGIGWAGILRDNNNIIGTCGFNHFDFPNLRAEIGGELSTDYWGKKIALEAVQAIVTFGFRRMKLRTIEAKVFPKNRGAIYLLKFLGFEKEAHFKDRIYFNGLFSDLAVYTLRNNT